MSVLFRSNSTRIAFGVAAVALSIAAPASAGVEGQQYPTAVAADAADVMARYGGVVIDVESRFAAPALDYFGCGVVKHEAKTSPDKRTFNYADCAARIIKVDLPPSTPVPPQ